MKISDVQRGEASTLELKPIDDDGFEQAIEPLREAHLFASGLSDVFMLRIGDRAWEVRGVNARNQALLRQIAAKNQPKMAWVAATFPRASRNPKSLLLEVREFLAAYSWDGAIDLGVDEKIVDTVHKKKLVRRDTKRVLEWLTDKVLISDPDGTSRALLSGSPVPQADQLKAGPTDKPEYKPGGFRLYGEDIAIDVACDAEDRLLVTRLVEDRKAGAHSETRPVFLVRGRFRFTDHTIAAYFRGAARNQLEQLVKNADSYMNLWHEYNQLETRNILRHAQEVGWLAYTHRTQLPDGRWHFSLKPAPALEQRIRFLEDDKPVELEAAAHPPAWMSEAKETKGNQPDGAASSSERVFSGKYVSATLDPRPLPGRGRSSPEQKGASPTLDLRPPSGQEDDGVPPPDKGGLFVNHSLALVRLDRQKEAVRLIKSAGGLMPQLFFLIEGKYVPEPRRKKEKPRSAAARQAFGGEPTLRQIEAIQVALNTPDIALIQGPPGTGKTRTIAALQTRLSEIAEDAERRAGSSLLTSTQHDAVENVARATQVFGLPAIKIGHKYGQPEAVDGVEPWCRDKLDKLKNRPVQVQETPVDVAFRRCRDLAVGYLEAPSRGEDVGALLDKIGDMAGPYLNRALADQILELSQKAKQDGQTARIDDPERELALKAIRGIRVERVPFEDDGPKRALKAFHRLEDLGVLDDTQRACLRQASDWDEERAPPFMDVLQKLQTELLDKLLPDERPANAPVVNADVKETLDKVIDALGERVRSTPAGIPSVLEAYRHDLESDPEGVREAVKKYTMVLAATCQQAVGPPMRQQKDKKIEFETVVVDEAARANPLDLFIPMALARRRIILVGDHRQLPHILEPDIEHDLEKNVNETTEEMLRKSLFERLFTAMRAREQEDGIKRTVTLGTQYRMHPVLGKFVSDTFYKPYGEAFESGYAPEKFAHKISRYDNAVAAWVDIPLARGREVGPQSKKRVAEAQWIAGEVHRILGEQPDYSLGVITFYKAQVGELMHQMEAYRFSERQKEGLHVGTVDAFQGKEFDVVLLSMTRSNAMPAQDGKTLRGKYGHLMLANRLCVAMSRQKRLLIVVGDAAMVRPEAAAAAVPGLVRFHELCGGAHGVYLHP